MREITASEAARNFSTVLDSAEHGETLVVTRAGKRIALITPAPRANGGALRDVLHRWQGNPAVDEGFAANVVAAKGAASAQADANPWSD